MGVSRIVKEPNVSTAFVLELVPSALVLVLPPLSVKGWMNWHVA
jgi:hypothetical protein